MYGNIEQCAVSPDPMGLMWKSVCFLCNKFCFSRDGRRRRKYVCLFISPYSCISGSLKCRQHGPCGCPWGGCLGKGPSPAHRISPGSARGGGALLKKRGSADLSSQGVLHVSWFREGLLSPKTNQTGKRKKSVKHFPVVFL